MVAPAFAQSSSDRSSAPVADNSSGSRAVLELLSEIDLLAVRLKQRADLPHAEHTVLEILDRLGPMTVPQIARQRCTSRQNIQIMVDRLHGDGRVLLSSNPAHKRSAMVCLTDSGKQWLQASQKGSQDLLLAIGSRVALVEIRKATSVLQAIRQSLSTDQKQTRSVSLAVPARGVVAPEVPLPALENAPAQAEEFPVNLL